MQRKNPRRNFCKNVWIFFIEPSLKPKKPGNPTCIKHWSKYLCNINFYPILFKSDLINRAKRMTYLIMNASLATSPKDVVGIRAEISARLPNLVNDYTCMLVSLMISDLDFWPCTGDKKVTCYVLNMTTSHPWCCRVFFKSYNLQPSNKQLDRAWFGFIDWGFCEIS